MGIECVFNSWIEFIQSNKKSEILRSISFILLLLVVTSSFGQTRRGIYKKKDCFCGSHSNSTGWNVGVAGYASQFNFSNEVLDGSTLGYGYGVFGANKVNEHFAVRLGFYRGKLLPIQVAEDASRSSLYNDYSFKHLNVPLSFLYKFRSEKRLSPYLTVGGEANFITEAQATSTNFGEEINNDLEDETGFNQFNLFLGAGTYILFGDHFGMLFQTSVDMNPFVDYVPNYNFAFTGKVGLTYHF